MAYQSLFTGPQIDDVIRICRTGNNLENLAKLNEYLGIIENSKTLLDGLFNQGGTIPPGVQDALNQKLSLSGGIFTGQISKSIDCSNNEAPSKALIRINNSRGGPVKNGYAPLYTLGIPSGDFSGGIHSSSEDGYKLAWYHHAGSASTELASITTAGQVFGAVWNDFAEFRASDENEPGRVVCENGNGTLSRSYKRLQPGAAIISDTYGFAIGKTEQCRTPIAVAGRVLAYTYEDWWTFEPGEPVCAGPDGTVSKMTRREVRKYPDRIIGTVSELPTYDTWGQESVEVNGRIWIHVK